MRPIHQQYLELVASRLEREAVPYNGTVELSTGLLTLTSAPKGAEASGDWTIRLTPDEESIEQAQDAYSPIAWNLTGARLQVATCDIPAHYDSETLRVHDANVVRWLDMTIARRHQGTSLRHHVAMATAWMEDFHDLKQGANEPRSYFDNADIEYALYEQAENDSLGINRMGEHVPSPWEDERQPFLDFA
jgi:hypothetical protein